MNYFYINF